MAAVRADVIGLALVGLMLAVGACGSHSRPRSTAPGDDVAAAGATNEGDGISTPSGGRPMTNGGRSAIDPGIGAGPGEGGSPADPDVGGKDFGGAWPTVGGAADEAGGAASASIDVAPSNEPVLVVSERGAATIAVSLGAPPSANVLINLESSAPEHAAIAPAGLVFTPKNWAQPQLVKVQGVDDHALDGDHPAFIVTAPAKSNDPRYEGLDADDVRVLVLDETAAGVVVAHEALYTNESGGTAQFAIWLSSKPEASVTFALSSSDVTEGTVPASITIAPNDWAKPQFVTVTGVDDVELDGNVSYEIVIGAATSDDPAYAGRVPSPVAVSNVDND